MGSVTRIDRPQRHDAAPRGLPCLLVAERDAIPVLLRDVSGAGARVETAGRPTIGATVTLRHPQAGAIAARVVAVDRTGLRLDFDRSEAAIGFALGAIAAGMAAR